MKKLRSLWERIRKAFEEDEDNDGPNLESFKTDLFEDLREELANDIHNDKTKSNDFKGIMDEIYTGIKLNNPNKKNLYS